MPIPANFACVNGRFSNLIKQTCSITLMFFRRFFLASFAHSFANLAVKKKKKFNRKGRKVQFHAVYSTMSHALLATKTAPGLTSWSYGIESPR